MSGILSLPDGTVVRSYAISAAVVQDTGVSIMNTSGNQMAFITEPHPQVRRKIAATIMNCLVAGKNLIPPNWGELYVQWRDEFAPPTA